MLEEHGYAAGCVKCNRAFVSSARLPARAARGAPCAFRDAPRSVGRCQRGACWCPRARAPCALRAGGR
eukprot:15197263-Alexandrium_andersonii.AAC.1